MSVAGAAILHGNGALRRPVALLGCAALLTVLLPIPPARALQPLDYLKRFDHDGDGRVDLVEFQAYMIRGFDRLDANRNGVLDLDEQPAAGRRGPVSRIEQLRAFADVFLRQDLDRDGLLDAAELAAPPR